MTADPHFGFVVAAYAIAFVTVATMIFAVTRDYVELRRALARMGGRIEQDNATRPDGRSS